MLYPIFERIIIKSSERNIELIISLLPHTHTLNYPHFPISFNLPNNYKTLRDSRGANHSNQSKLPPKPEAEGETGAAGSTDITVGFRFNSAVDQELYWTVNVTRSAITNYIGGSSLV